jgi:hypothetical protein
VKLARFAVQAEAVPIEDPVRRVAVLLDLVDEQPAAKRMQAAASSVKDLPSVVDDDDD